MKPGWNTLYDEVKDRRYAMVFLLGPLALLGPLVLVAVLFKSLAEAGLLPHAVCGGVIWAACFVVVLRRTRARQRERWERKQLSDDELRVARSKLRRSQNGRTNAASQPGPIR